MVARSNTYLSCKVSLSLTSFTPFRSGGSAHDIGKVQVRVVNFGYPTCVSIWVTNTSNRLHDSMKLFQIKLACSAMSMFVQWFWKNSHTYQVYDLLVLCWQIFSSCFCGQTTEFVLSVLCWQNLFHLVLLRSHYASHQRRTSAPQRRQAASAAGQIYRPKSKASGGEETRSSWFPNDWMLPRNAHCVFHHDPWEGQSVCSGPDAAWSSATQHAAGWRHTRYPDVDADEFSQRDAVHMRLICRSSLLSLA